MFRNLRHLPLLATVALTCCADPQGATQALLEKGYTQIYIVGFSPKGCDRKHDYSTGFEALNAAGRQVSGVVCRVAGEVRSEVRADR